jgi:hypothetical protein
MNTFYSWQNLLPEQEMAETRAILQKALSPDATEEVITMIHSVTGGVFRSVDMMIPRLLELRLLERRHHVPSFARRLRCRKALAEREVRRHLHQGLRNRAKRHRRLGQIFQVLLNDQSDAWMRW